MRGFGVRFPGMAPDSSPGVFFFFRADVAQHRRWRFAILISLALPLPREASMLYYAIWFYWTAARGYRLRPWRSPYLRWRIETFSGIRAPDVTFALFWQFLWSQRQGVGRFLDWGAEMRRLEQRLRREGDIQSKTTD